MLEKDWNVIRIGAAQAQVDKRGMPDPSATDRNLYEPRASIGLTADWRTYSHEFILQPNAQPIGFWINLGSTGIVAAHTVFPHG